MGLEKPNDSSVICFATVFSYITINLLVANNAALPSIWVLVFGRILTFVLIVGLQHVPISITLDGFMHIVSIIYVAITVFDRKVLWSELCQVTSSVTGPWYVIGDFNTCLGAHEKLGDFLLIYLVVSSQWPLMNATFQRLILWIPFILGWVVVVRRWCRFDWTRSFALWLPLRFGLPYLAFLCPGIT